MRCPRCKMAFADFTGCNALYCAYAGCGANFCALCFKDCGGGVKFGQKNIVMSGSDPVHKHLANECKYAKGKYFGDAKAIWNQVRKARIEDALKEMLDDPQVCVAQQCVTQRSTIHIISLPSTHTTLPTSLSLSTHTLPTSSRSTHTLPTYLSILTGARHCCHQPKEAIRGAWPSDRGAQRIQQSRGKEEGRYDYYALGRGEPPAERTQVLFGQGL